MKTPLRYAGGKSKAYKKITPFIPKDTERIISPFIGGGSLEVKWSYEKNISVIGYDIFYHLVNFWNELLENPENLAEELKKLRPNKEEYNRIKELLLCWEETQKLLENWKTDYYKRDPIILDKTKAAAYYFFNHNLSYGPAFLGWLSRVYANEQKWERMINEIRNFRNNNLSVGCDSFENVIKRFPNDFLYLDPPYYLEDNKDNKMFKGMYPMANFPIHHEGFDHELLRDLLYSHKEQFILSYNNCKTIREWYSDFYFFFPSWHYSFGQGETRIGKNKENNEPKKSHEIIITNFKPEKRDSVFDVVFK